MKKYLKHSFYFFQCQDFIVSVDIPAYPRITDKQLREQKTRLKSVVEEPLLASTVNHKEQAKQPHKKPINDKLSVSAVELRSSIPRQRKYSDTKVKSADSLSFYDSDERTQSVDDLSSQDYEKNFVSRNGSFKRASMGIKKPISNGTRLKNEPTSDEKQVINDFDVMLNEMKARQRRQRPKTNVDEAHGEIIIV